MSETTKQTRPECCADCHFWVQENEDQITNKAGMCRRLPPLVGEHLVPGGKDFAGRNMLNRMHWQRIPMTRSNEWCGEFRMTSRITLS